MAELALEGLGKVFPDGTAALRGVDLAVGEGELLVLVGPSGCGKSTLLRLVAGLERPSAGRVRIGGRDVTTLPPQRRDVAMVFQNYALYPHLSVAGNLAFPLRMRGVPRAQRRRRVAEVAALLGLEGLLERRPGELSGGQRQRVAMGRALVRRPQVLLLDEPLSNLDARLRVQLRAELAALQRRTGVTTLHVTHDQAEAMTLGHRVAVLRAGRLEQVGQPEALYREPATAFVAAFLGSPGMNLLAARLEPAPGGWRLAVAGAA
ncbi:MAG: ABC transporter ATP-binding protein, partial [Gammaproteobacteria bacterium]